MAALLCMSCLRQEEEEVTELDYRHCSLDDVPNEIFAYERTLETLRLDSNNIRDLPRPLFHCHGLKELNLADNELGSIPSAVSSLALLTSLDVSKNVLTDLPETIKQCKHLAMIQASVNPLQKIPEGCTQLISLTQLCLNDCLLEYIPANFGRLARLRVLELRENSLTSLPRSMERLVSLTRIDLSQNQFTEIPEVLNTMFELEELLLDGNKLKTLPPFIGHFTKLKHLDASFNQLENICDELGNCVSLVDLTLSSNDLKHVPESLECLTRLVTLKLDDNQLEKLPDNLGRMTSLEELYGAENFLTYLPPSIGWLRRLHTLNVDENDLEDLPPEIGSCRQMKIFSVHGNKLSGLPDEVGHLSQLAVLNLAGNYIPHLPVSFIKLKSITAIWLANNQTKPLVQLNTDLDPITGLKVLTNFLLPQQPDPDRNGDNNSDSGSFHASVWEEERSKRSLVKWAGDESLDLDKTGNLRRAPTPFPKEMRAMAKKVANMKERKAAEEERNNKRRNTRETVRRRADGSHKNRAREVECDQGVALQSQDRPRDGQASDKVSRDSGVISPSDTGLETEDTEAEDLGCEEETGSKTGAPLQVHDTPTLVHNNNYLPPVQAELVTNELEEEEGSERLGSRKLLQHMPPPYHIAATKSKQAGNFYNIRDQQQQSLASQTSQEPGQEEEHFYENQEAVKRAGVNGKSKPLERKSSFLSDGTFESISESETSTAPSSLQTIIRAPYALSLADSSNLTQDGPIIGQNHKESALIGQYPPSHPPPGRSSESESEAALTSANALRKVSEQLLNTSRTRNSISRPGSVALSTPQVSRLPLATSRPSSQQGHMTPVTSRSAQPPGQLSRSAQLPSNTHTGREMRPNSFAGPPNTVGLPVNKTHGLQSSQEHGHVASKYSTGGSNLQKLSQQQLPEANGLLSTISQAAISDDESPPATHKPHPPKFNTAVLSRPSPPLDLGLPNYENVGLQNHQNHQTPHNNTTYMPMSLRKTSSTPLATSSPSGIPRYTPSVK